MTSDEGAPNCPGAPSSLVTRQSSLSGSHPMFQALDVRRVAQLLERALPYLADPFAGDAEQRADLLQGQRLGAFLQPVIQGENLPLTRGEVPLEEPVDELAAEPGVGLLLDVAGPRPRDPLAEGAGAAVGPLNRGVERYLGTGHAAGRT